MLTSDEVARVAETGNDLGFFDPAQALDALANKEQLDHWASATDYIQIDSISGDPIGKSSNMADLTVPPYSDASSDRHFAFAQDRDGTQLLVFDRVLRRGGIPIAVVHVAERLDVIESETRRARAILAFVTVAALVVVVAASAFIARGAVDPIVRLTAEIARIGSAHLDRRLHWHRGDELGTLANAFDAMLDRLQEAFARERQFISDASHELKTPLTVINANAQMIRRWGDADPQLRRESLDAIVEESQRLAEMVSGMLTLSKADTGDEVPKEAVSLGAVVEDVVAHARERAVGKGLVLRSDVPAPVTVLGDPGLLRQLISNLVDNAIKFTESGEIVASATRADAAVRVAVSDTGVGIEPATADRLFDRFFRGDTSHSRTIEGTGLGLAIVRAIARVHGGTVSAAARPGGGSVFTVDLPVRLP